MSCENAQKRKMLIEKRERIGYYLERVSSIAGDEVIGNELIEIKKRYNITSFDNTIVRYYLDNPKVKRGSIIKSFYKVEEVLRIYEFSDEQIRNYINKNGIVVVNKPLDLILRMAMLEKAGLLKEALINRQKVISRPFIEKELSNKELYDFAVYNSFDITIEDIINYSKSLKTRDNSKLSKTQALELLNDFNEHIENIRNNIENVKKIGRN